jgi:hypothetical protein
MSPQATIALMFASLICTACVSTISPNRQDVAIVEGRVDLSGLQCGTVPKDGGGYYYVCDMPLDVERVIFGSYAERRASARFFAFEVESEEAIVTGPNFRRDRRVAAIIWARETRGSFVVLHEGRWCVPNWMVSDFEITPVEVASLKDEGFPLCEPS